MEPEHLLSNSKYCRLCCEENKNGIHLFTEEDNSEDLSTLVNRYLPIKVDVDDPYPKLICPGCHIQLEASKLFMDLILEGQAKLRKLLKTQQDRVEREEKERKKLEEALKNHNPNASVETYTIQTDENGEKFIIQIYSEGPLFLPEHELAWKAEGLKKPKRKRGRPPKVVPNPDSEQLDNGSEEQGEIKEVVSTTSETEQNEVPVKEETTTDDFDTRRKRRIKAPARYAGVVQGRELDKILKKEGVIDEDIEDVMEEGKNTVGDSEQESGKPIGRLVTNDGALEEPVYPNRRRVKLKKYRGHKQKHRYTCGICNKEFQHSGRYELHKKSHKIKFACQERGCQFQDENRSIVEQHQIDTEHDGISKIEHIEAYNGTVILPDSSSLNTTGQLEDPPEVSEDKPITCPICEKSFACKQNYEVHLKAIHDREKPFRCGKCTKSFAYACSLKAHVMSHNNKDNGIMEQFGCEKCEKIFNHPSSLIYHKETEHGTQRFICNKCDRSFKHRQLLQRHQTVHTEERPFHCSACSQTFKTKTNLINHENCHTGLKKFTCSICGQSFMHKTSLSAHLRWHEGHKPYECDVCKKAFSQKGNLIEHKRIHTGEKPYTCDLCGRSFTTSSQWKLHSKRHTGEKPYSCEYCQKRFLHKDTLVTHIRRHLDIRPFGCSFCEKKFAEAWACSRHQRLHLGEKPYHCDVCDKAFSDASNFNKHSKIHQRNGIKPSNLDTQARNSKDTQFQSDSIDVEIIIPYEPEPTTQKESDTEVISSNSLQFQELLDADGNIISLTTADGQPIPIVSSDNEKIQGLMPDGTLVSFDILNEEQSNKSQSQPAKEVANQEINLINTDIQFLEENSMSSTVGVDKPAFLLEDGKVCLISSFDENSFLTMS